MKWLPDLSTTAACAIAFNESRGLWFEDPCHIPLSNVLRGVLLEHGASRMYVFATRRDGMEVRFVAASGRPDQKSGLGPSSRLQD